MGQKIIQRIVKSFLLAKIEKRKNQVMLKWEKSDVFTIVTRIPINLHE